MSDFKATYTKVKTFVVLSQGKSVRSEFSLVKWGISKVPVYDLRKWDSNGEPKKGISFDKSSLEKIYCFLKVALKEKLEDVEPIQIIQTSKMRIEIIKEIGVFASNSRKQEEKKITFANWGSGYKYDFRTWYYKDDELKHGKGILLSKEETETLFKTIEKIINEDEDPIREALIEDASVVRSSSSTNKKPAKDKSDYSKIIENILL